MHYLAVTGRNRNQRGLTCPCSCTQVHPECDGGAGHHSGQKPRSAPSLHHAGYGCDAEAGKCRGRARELFHRTSMWRFLCSFIRPNRCLEVTGTFPGSEGKSWPRSSPRKKTVQMSMWRFNKKLRQLGKKKVCLRGSEEEERKLARQNEREWLWGLWKGHNEKTHVTYWELQVIE